MRRRERGTGGYICRRGQGLRDLRRYGRVGFNLRCGFTGPSEAKGDVDAHTFVLSL